MKSRVIKNRIEFNLYPDEESYQQAVNLSFEVDQDMSLTELHRLCCRFAACLGFAEKSIEEVFGEENYD